MARISSNNFFILLLSKDSVYNSAGMILKINSSMLKRIRLLPQAGNSLFIVCLKHSLWLWRQKATCRFVTFFPFLREDKPPPMRVVVD
jgi:hypothetical protein